MLAKNETYGICTREHECCVGGPSSFQEELETLINKHSVDNTMNTPDFILARYLMDCLATFNSATVDRDISRNSDKTQPCAEPEYAGTEIMNITVPGPDEDGMHRESAGTLSIGNSLITHQFKTDAEIDREIWEETTEAVW